MMEIKVAVAAEEGSGELKSGCRRGNPSQISAQ